MKAKILTGLLVSVCCGLTAQEVIPINAEPETAARRTIKPTADLDPHFSRLRNYNWEIDNVRIWGFRAGVLVAGHRPYKTGLGYYFLNTRTFSRLAGTACIGCYTRRNLDFGTVYFEPFWLRRRYWYVSTPLDAGYGRASEQVYDATETRRAVRNGGFVPLSAGLAITLKPPAIRHFRPLQWFGLNASAGYRYVLEHKDLATQYDGVFYTVRLAFFLDRFTDDAARWHKARKNRRTKK